MASTTPKKSIRSPQESTAGSQTDFADDEIRLRFSVREGYQVIADLYHTLERSKPCIQEYISPGTINETTNAFRLPPASCRQHCSVPCTQEPINDKQAVQPQDILTRICSIPTLVSADDWFCKSISKVPQSSTQTVGSCVGRAPLRSSTRAINLKSNKEKDKDIGEFKVRPWPVGGTDRADRVEGLIEIEERIMERARNYRFITRRSMLKEALAANRADIQNIERELAHLCATTPEDKRTNVRSVRHDYLKDLLPWLRLRLHWLELWEQLERAQCRKTAKKRLNILDSDTVKKRPSNPRLNHFTALIKPVDVFEAHEAIDQAIENTDPTDDTTELIPRLLAIWYAQMLWKCGADWKDLRRIRRARKMPMNRVFPVKRCARWRQATEVRQTPFFARWSEYAIAKYTDGKTANARKKDAL